MDLSAFGFTSGVGGAHIARTMMLDELIALLDYVDDVNAKPEDYAAAIEEDNCLGKRSVRARKLTWQHLQSLYAFDPEVTLFRALLYFWRRDEAGRPLLALLCAYARDAVLRMSAPFVLGLNQGATITRQETEAFFEAEALDRFSPATVKSVAQNVNGTWTRSGHLTGRVRKTRTRPRPTAGAASYALLLGFLTGVRGEALFQTRFMKLLDCSVDEGIELAESASRKGWIVTKRAGDVIEVLFPTILNQKEMELLRGQS